MAEIHWSLISLELCENALDGSFKTEGLPQSILLVNIDGNNFCSTLDLTALPREMRDFFACRNKLYGSLNFTNLPQNLVVLGLAENAFIGVADLSQLPANFQELIIATNQLCGPKRLRGHLEGRHKEFLHYTEEMFQEKTERFHLHGALAKFNFKPISKAASKALCQMAELLAQECRPHTDGVNLIKKGSVTMAMTIRGEEVSKKFNEVPLSNKTMKRRISDMSIDIEDQVVQDLRESAQPFSLQLDESTDEASCCQLLAYVNLRYFTIFSPPSLCISECSDNAPHADAAQVPR